MTRALLIGREPGAELGYDYVSEPPYEAVVIGSLTLGQLLRFREENPGRTPKGLRLIFNEPLSLETSCAPCRLKKRTRFGQTL